MAYVPVLRQEWPWAWLSECERKTARVDIDRTCICLLRSPDSFSVGDCGDGLNEGAQWHGLPGFPGPEGGARCGPFPSRVVAHYRSDQGDGQNSSIRVNPARR